MLAGVLGLTALLFSLINLYIILTFLLNAKAPQDILKKTIALPGGPALFKSKTKKTPKRITELQEYLAEIEHEAKNNG